MTGPQYPYPPQGYPPPGPPPPPPPKSPWRSARLAGALAGGVAAALAAVLVLVFVVFGGDDSDNSAGEVFLEPTAGTGPDPFSPSAAIPQPPATNPGPDPAGNPSSGNVVRTASGGIPGLYGGTRNISTCDSETMIAFLAQNPDKARAWAGVFGIVPSDIPAFVRDLTPVLLRTDTRVTNHGFLNGRPTPRQAVLQAGTAVLVDKFGAPRVRCACGNPLLDPVATKVKPRYSGPKWQGFSPTTITVIQQNNTQINIYTLYDPTTGNTFGRPVGSTGQNDVDDPRVAETDTPTATRTEQTPTRTLTPTTTEPARAGLDDAIAKLKAGAPGCEPFPDPIAYHERQEFYEAQSRDTTFVFQVLGYTEEGEVQDFDWLVDRETLSFTPVSPLAEIASEHCPALN